MCVMVTGENEEVDCLWICALWCVVCVYVYVWCMCVWVLVCVSVSVFVTCDL